MGPSGFPVTYKIMTKEKEDKFKSDRDLAANNLQTLSHRERERRRRRKRGRREERKEAKEQGRREDGSGSFTPESGGGHAARPRVLPGESSWTEEPGGPRSAGPHRVGHD